MGVQINGSEGNVIATKGTYSGNVTIGGTLTYEDVTNIDSVGIITARSGIEIGASPGVGASISVDGNAIFSGITTATTLRAPTGIVTSLEATTGDITTLRAPTGIVTSFVTNTAKVGAAVTITESGIEASGIGITVASINGGSISGRRNLIINGAMQVAQRGTSSSSTSIYNTVDRIRNAYGTQDEIQTNSQAALSSSDSPYTEGLRYYHRTQNGNQTSGAQAGSYVIRSYKIEAQDMAQSGWNYTNPNSFITLQFWVRSSVAQDYNFEFFTQDGTNQTYSFIFTLAANTWTKVIRTIPGNSNLQFDNDNGSGFTLNWYPYIGTTYTASDTTLDAWHQRTGTYRRTMTTTWFTTNDSTFDITGVQLEVGTQATAFEHRSFTEELALCQRYYCHTYSYGTYPGSNKDSVSEARQGMVFSYRQRDNNYQAFFWSMPTAMRAVPTQTMYSMLGTAGKASGSQTDYTVNTNSPHNGASGVMAYGINTIADDGYVHFVLDAEL